MRAAIRRKYVQPEELKVEQIEKPVPKDDEVLIEVHATTVNRTDMAILTGKPFIMRFFIGLLNPSSPILGTDFAGKVSAIGSAVTKFQVGDHVWGFRDEGLNSQAEFMCYPESGNIAVFPKALSFGEAASSLEGAHYALNTVNKVGIKAGQKILINGATGAIGSALLQFCNYYDTDVDATCNGKNIDLIKSLGANRIFNYEKEDFTKSEEIYDFIFDSVGKSTFGKCKPLLRDNGCYISSELGPYWQNPFLAISTRFIGKKQVKFPLPTDIKRSMSFMADIIEEGHFRPVIDREYPLEKIAEAYQYVNTGQKTGNVVIRYQS